MRSRPSVAAITGIVALVAFTVWITWRAKKLEMSSSGENRALALLNKTAPDFTLPALDGRMISLRDYRGKKLVVSFWASWCGPCRLEMPVLASFYRRAHKPDANFDMLAISLDEDRDSALVAAHQAKLPFPVLLDASQKTAGAYGVYAIPALMVIDRTGRVTYGGFGFSTATVFVLVNQLGLDPKLATEPTSPAQKGSNAGLDH